VFRVLAPSALAFKLNKYKFTSKVDVGGEERWKPEYSRQDKMEKCVLGMVTCASSPNTDRNLELSE
jgi:hypothetical protein